jgi:hypothetical protein
VALEQAVGSLEDRHAGRRRLLSATGRVVATLQLRFDDDDSLWAYVGELQAPIALTIARLDNQERQAVRRPSGSATHRSARTAATGSPAWSSTSSHCDHERQAQPPIAGRCGRADRSRASLRSISRWPAREGPRDVPAGVGTAGARSRSASTTPIPPGRRRPRRQPGSLGHHDERIPAFVRRKVVFARDTAAVAAMATRSAPPDLESGVAEAGGEPVAGPSLGPAMNLVPSKSRTATGRCCSYSRRHTGRGPLRATSAVRARPRSSRWKGRQRRESSAGGSRTSWWKYRQ